MFSVSPAAGAPDPVLGIAPVQMALTLVDQLFAFVHEPSPAQPSQKRVVAAATYGLTTGPPSPTGGEPTGSVESVDSLAAAALRFSRPLPSGRPIASAARASRLTITPFETARSTAFNSPAEPATAAAAAEVPLIVTYEPAPAVVEMFVPGAAMKTSWP